MWNYNYTTTYIAHHGIFGQKWGRRRYQNKDGSLTPQGKLRYGRMQREESEASKMNKKINTMKDAFTLKKGSHIHRSTYDAEDANREGHAFASFKTKDAKGYASRNKLFSGGKKHLIYQWLLKKILYHHLKKKELIHLLN